MFLFDPSALERAVEVSRTELPVIAVPITEEIKKSVSVENAEAEIAAVAPLWMTSKLFVRRWPC